MSKSESTSPVRLRVYNRREDELLLPLFRLGLQGLAWAACLTSRDISDIQLRRTVVQIQRNVRYAYCGLVFAQSLLEVQRQSPDLAEESRATSESRLHSITRGLRRGPTRRVVVNVQPGATDR